MQKSLVFTFAVIASSVLFGCGETEKKSDDTGLSKIEQGVDQSPDNFDPNSFDPNNFDSDSFNPNNNDSQSSSTESTENNEALALEKKARDARFKSIEWIDLIPKNDLDALMNPPEYLNEILDGSVEDQMVSQIENAISSANDDRYQQALVSIDVIPEMDNQAIKIPGFVVPLEFNEDQTVTQFFLVPFFGACIHQPPPPPNQIIFVNYPKGLELNTLYDPYWISGVLSTSIVQKELGTAAYTMEMEHGEIYTE